MSKDSEKTLFEEHLPEEETHEELPTAPDVAEDVVEETKVPDVEVILDPEFGLDAEVEEVAVSVAGLDPADDFTDEHGRVVVSATPVAVPADIAELLIDSSPAVTTAEEVKERDE